jgi:hypothetical protein
MVRLVSTDVLNEESLASKRPVSVRLHHARRRD